MRTWGEEPFAYAVLLAFSLVTGPYVAHRSVDALRPRVGVGWLRFAAGGSAGLQRADEMTDDAAATPADADLMARVAAGDQEAFAMLYDRHVRAVYGAVLRYVGDPGIAEDVVQETYLAIWQRPDGYAAEKGSLIGWLLAVARNRAIDRLRAAARRPLLVGLHAGTSDGTDTDLERLIAVGRPVGLSATQDEPADVSERRWVQAVVRTALAGMSGPERQVLELAYDEGLTQTEIAVRLGWPTGTVKTRTRRGLARLRAMLESVPDIVAGTSRTPVAVPAGAHGVEDGSR
jgi:RNA polymerase sigma-70 factor (ECF subfamily)